MNAIKIPGECTVCGGQNGNHYPWCGHVMNRLTYAVAVFISALAILVSALYFSGGSTMFAPLSWALSVVVGLLVLPTVVREIKPARVKMFRRDHS